MHQPERRVGFYSGQPGSRRGGGAADKLADDITRRLLTRAQPPPRFPLDFLTRVSCTPISPIPPHSPRPFTNLVPGTRVEPHTE